MSNPRVNRKNRLKILAKRIRSLERRKHTFKKGDSRLKKLADYIIEVDYLKREER